jgi:adenylyltransferase/sulfurtransferase
VPGIIGLIQATEVLKFILRKGNLLIRKLLVYNSLESDFQTLSVEKNRLCPLCGQQPGIKGLVDYHDECRITTMAIRE